MLIVKTYIDKSTINGIGLFAGEDIRLGQVMWVFNSRFDSIIRQDEMSRYPELVQKYVDKYAWVGRDDGHLYIGIDDDKFCNHSDTPNKGYVHEDNTFIALRDIAKGEEITEDYSTHCFCGDELCST